MASLSPAIAENARKNERAILQAFARVSQARVAELMGVSDTKISRFKGPDLEEISALLAACGLKVVDLNAVLYDRNTAAALVTLASSRLLSINDPEDLACP